jgi:hypothetical protein
MTSRTLEICQVHPSQPKNVPQHRSSHLHLQCIHSSCSLLASRTFFRHDHELQDEGPCVHRTTLQSIRHPLRSCSGEECGLVILIGVSVHCIVFCCRLDIIRLCPLPTATCLVPEGQYASIGCPKSQHRNTQTRVLCHFPRDHHAG